MKKLFLQLFCTKLGWLLISGILLIVFGILTNWYDWAYLASGIALIYPLGLLIAIVIYWIANPFKRNKK